MHSKFRGPNNGFCNKKIDDAEWVDSLGSMVIKELLNMIKRLLVLCLEISSEINQSKH
jgi:hypothetical protein